VVEMRKLNIKKVIMTTGFIIIIFWPLYQLHDVFTSDVEKQDASKMLYQVSLFQLEMLNSYLNEAVNVQHTEQLHALKQAAYSANFTHERYVLAVGSDKLIHLDSISAIMQYVLRMQIGGQREVKETERKTLEKASRAFKDVYHTYEVLLSSSGQIIKGKNNELKKIDREIFDYLGEKLLE
jgi:hypothetical protein